MKQLPKFLTEDLIQAVRVLVYNIITSQMIALMPKRQACHIVVLVPEQVTDVPGVEYPSYPVRPVILFEQSFGNKEPELDAKDDGTIWTADYADIARCKAFKLWHGMNDGRTDILPHLMYSGDCPYWGGVKRDGIVVACSGVEPYFDRMIASMVADMLIAGAYHAWMKSGDKKDEVDNLS